MKVKRGPARPFGAIAHAALNLSASKAQKKAWNRGDNPRSGQPVWRNSYYVDTIEKRIWRPINGGGLRQASRWIGYLMKAARKLEHKTRAERQKNEPGARNGALGEVGLRVLEYLYSVVDYSTGRLEPAIRTIAEEIGHAYSAVHRALVRLRRYGFLQWIRRSKPVDNPEPGGPLVQQASNAYALLVPDGMGAYVSKLFNPGPVPACEEARKAQEKADFDAMLASVTRTEAFEVTKFTEDALLGMTLKRVAAALDRRDSLTANPPPAMKPGDHIDP